MRTARTFLASASAVLAIFLVGCHHQAPPTLAAAPAVLREHYCWWAVYRTSVPLDTVVARFTRAYASVGFTSSTLSRAGDTVWVNAVPSPLGPGGQSVAARLVGYTVGSSTHFRTFVASADSSASPIPLCQQIARVAAVGIFAPREPDGEEKLGIWTRRR